MMVSLFNVQRLPYATISALATRLIFLLLTVFALSPAQASESNPDSLEAEREAFKKLESLAQQGKLLADDPRLIELRTYPLFPYVEYHRIRARGAAMSVADVERFRAQYPDMHLEGLLRWHLVHALAKREQWSDLLSYYNSLSKPSAELQCLHARALLQTGEKQAGIDEAKSLWQAGQSQPDACDPLFDQLRAKKLISSEMALNRVLNALENNKLGLAKYAQRYISRSEDKAVATAALSIFQRPDTVRTIGKSVRLTSDQTARLQYIALKRAYRSGAISTINLAVALGNSLKNSDSIEAIKTRAGIRLSKDLNPKSEQILAQFDPEYELAEVTEWRIRLALYDQNWDRAYQLIQQLPEETRNENRWQYWSALTAANRSNQQPEFGELVQTRSFYGFLASERTGAPYALNQQSPRYTDEVYAALEGAEPMTRIRELVALDRFTVARSELNQWKERLSKEDRQAVAHLLRDMEWHQQGILTAAYEGLWNDLKLRFPVVHMSAFEEHSEKRSIDPIWALAISRQESALFPKARSSAGARGLMQLMPKTASQTARTAGISYSGVRALYNTDTNIQLGTAYLGQMYEKFEGNRAYASAAYNAGPHRVTRWLSGGADQLPLDIWIETIPFDETRNYVQNVLSFALIYAELTGAPTRMLNERERTQLAMR